MATQPARPKSARKQPAEAEAPVRSPLTPFQEHICDLAGDLILNGGHEDEINSLIYACMGHEWRRRFPDQDPARQEHSLARYTNRWISDWYRKLSRHWPEEPGDGPAKEPDTAAEQSVSERIRSTVREDLKDRFEEFLGAANPEELRLLRDVFMSAESSRGGPDDVPLAESFSWEIGQHADYIRVPGRHEKLVRQYLELLEKSGTADDTRT